MSYTEAVVSIIGKASGKDRGVYAEFSLQRTEVYIKFTYPDVLLKAITVKSTHFVPREHFEVINKMILRIQDLVRGREDKTGNYTYLIKEVLP